MQKNQVCTYQKNTQHSIAIQFSIINDQYTVLQKIDQNQQESFYRGKINSSKKQVLITLINLVEIQHLKGFRFKQLTKRKTKAEAELKQKCNSIYLPKQYDIFENSKYKVIISEFNPRKSLEQQTIQKKYNELESIIILKQIICALHELNKYTYAHTSLEPKNIVFSYGIYKIVEFGYNKLIEESKKDFSEELGSPNQFIAPQIHKDQSHDLRAQVWNVAVIFYFLIFKKLPFFHYLQNSNEKIQLQRNGISKIAQNFLEKALQLNPNNRMNWNQMIAHPLFDKGGLELPRYFLVNPEIKCFSYSKQYESQHRNTSVQKKLFVCEIEKPYVNEKFKLDIDKIEQQEDINILKKSIICQELEYFFFQDSFLQYQRTLWILTKIYNPIENYKLINKSRERKQFLYLLSFRCLTNLRFLKQRLVHIKSETKSEQQNVKFDYLLNIINTLQPTLHKNWQICSQKLQQHESRFASIIYDKIIRKNELEQEKFLGGFQNLDFQKQQQICFTYDYFEKYIRKQLHNVYQKNQKGKQGKLAYQIIKYLSNYPTISKYNYSKLKKENRTFQQVLNYFLNKE